MKYSFALLGAAALVNASPFPRPQAVTAQISPSEPAPSGCLTDYPTTFGVVAQNITASAAAAPVTTLPDGQPQASTGGAAVTTLPDGQPQAPTSAAAAVTTLPDGQPQAPTSAAAAITTLPDGQPQAPTGAPLSQISDGQIQAPTATMPAITQIGDGQIQAPTMAPITQIGDGQIQAPTAPPKPAVSQISDGQIQAPPASTAAAVTTLPDGQPQAPTAPASTAAAVTSLPDGQPQAPTGAAVTSLPDGQPQAPTAAASQLPDGQPQASAAPSGAPAPKMVACAGDSVLSMVLEGGVLTDSQGRIGYIASNFQFQFDGPPQAGAIYTSGWSVCGNGSLALGGQTTFYQCLSGDFYNLYNENWAAQCNAVTIDVLDLIDCP